MSAVFADTFFYLALLNNDDPFHDRALIEWGANRRVVTSEFILLELGNACARAEDHVDFLALALGMRQSPRTSIVPLSSETLNRGLSLMAERADKNWSLTDCTSFVLMDGEGISDALTGDKHFEQAGFKCLFR